MAKLNIGLFQQNKLIQAKFSRSDTVLLKLVIIQVEMHRPVLRIESRMNYYSSTVSFQLIEILKWLGALGKLRYVGLGLKQKK